MPKGVYDRSHIVIKWKRGPESKCKCGICKTCKAKAWRVRTGRAKEYKDFEGKKFNEDIDKEPLFDDLTFKLINHFLEKGWD